MSQTASTPPRDAPLAPDDYDANHIHHKLFSTRAEYDRISTLAEFRDGIDSLPETALTFTKRYVLDDTPQYAVSETLVEATGAWPAPPRYPTSTSTGNGARYINPTHPDAWRYTDVFAECECGALVSQVDVAHPDGKLDAQFDHTDDCKRIWRWRARLDLAESRRETARSLLRWGHNASEITARLGYNSPDATEAIYEHDIDYATAREDARYRIANTAAAALHSHSMGEIARAYGRSQQFISKLVRDHTSADATALFRYRRDQQAGGGDV